YADRKIIEDLFSKKGEADDILMTRSGWIMDTSIANIAFRKGERWYTPAQPLLAGTTWKRLISERLLIPRPIHQDEISSFEAFKIFNAMNGWGEVEEVTTKSIHHTGKSPPVLSI
ncbi:MAG TPA: aminotransferase class IV, partial [Saprospiraceae bacterium]|nr:aminotransferase class IV [Saprospiraceae bacterium]